MAHVTKAINHYDGIFKFVDEPRAQEDFLRARSLLADEDWHGAGAAFKEAKLKATGNEHDVACIELILHELERYQENLIPRDAVAKTVTWSTICERPIRRHDEPCDRLPQGIFFLTVQRSAPACTKILVGMKTLSRKWIENKIPELFCSIVRHDMLLGLFADQRITDSKVIIFYHPLDEGEKLGLFQEIVDNDALDCELVFPFPLLKTATRKEFTSPADGWQVDDVLDDMLSNGEEHIRQYTVHFLKSLHLTKATIFDPACSTGIFLSTLKKAFPEVYTIGQDLSQQMVTVSRDRLDEVHHGNALVPQINRGSADLVFVRFLNSEVVTSAEAEMFLEPLLKTVAVGGHFVVFGHTPVLLSAANFRSLSDFSLERCVAVTLQKEGLFQYYVLSRIR